MVRTRLLTSSAFLVVAGLFTDSSLPRTELLARPRHSTVVISSDDHPRRQWLRGRWMRIGGVRGEYLVQPQLLVAFGSTIFVFDDADRRLKAFSSAGQLLWSMGGPGAGPWEFKRPTDIETAPNGDVWVADPGNARISVIRSDGRPTRMIEMRSQTTRVIPLAWPFFARYDAQGQLVSGLPPPAELEHASALAAEPVVMVGPTGDAAVAFRWSGTLMIVGSDGAVRATTVGVEPIPFPETKSYKIKDRGGRELLVFRTDPKATWAAYSVAAMQDRAVVLFRGRTESAGRILDLYALRTATYLGSMLVPEAASRIAAIGNDLAVLYGDTKPHVDVMRWHSRP